MLINITIYYNKHDNIKLQQKLTKNFNNFCISDLISFNSLITAIYHSARKY